MAHHILIIDGQAEHRRVMQQFIERVHPNVHLYEHDPQEKGMPGPNFDWQNYDLLLLDNELGTVDGIQWLQQARQFKNFPPFIIISSTKNTQTPAAMEAVIRSIRMGAINYLFKKKIQLNQLNENILKVLEKAPDRPEPGTGSSKPPPSAEQKAIQNAQEAIEHTQHEIHLAMAILEGHAHWPFTMGDVLAGKASVMDYKVSSFLGNETIGSTFKVKHNDHDEPLIMYLINRQQEKSDGIPKTLLQELKYMKKITQRNVMPIRDYQVDGDIMIVIREMPKGETLWERMESQGFHKEHGIHLFRQLLSGLNALHMHDIVVKSYSPKSFRITAKDELIFIDTGLLNRLHTLSEVGSEITIQDMHKYVSPEQVQKRVLDRRTDIYIAGLIGYELIAGRSVYSEGSIKNIHQSHVNEDIPQLSGNNAPFNSLFNGMLQKTPSKRIQDVQSVISILDNLS